MQAENPLYNFVSRRRWLVVPVQLAIILLAYCISYGLRFDFLIPPNDLDNMLRLLPVLLLVKGAVFWAYGLFGGWWRYVSMADLIILARANILASLLFILVVVLVFRLGTIPRSVLILDGLLCFLFLGGVRFLTRAVRENHFPLMIRDNNDKRLLIIGAGDAGQMIAREIRQNSNINIAPVGFVDDDPRKARQRFQGLPVLGNTNDIDDVCERLDVTEIIIAIPTATGHDLQRIVDHCLRSKVRFRTLPAISELIDGSVSLDQVRKVEVEDLLGRDAVEIDAPQVAGYLKDKCVVVTGAGGSIGSELARQVASFRPSRLVLLDAAETPLFHIERELKLAHPDLRFDPVVCNVRDRSKVLALFESLKPQSVFHAAAYKHVPMLEQNPAEAVLNNVAGTMSVADASNSAGVRHFVMISTDKAVNPTNVMGATKRSAELYVQGLAAKSDTHFVTVRFGNVLGSNGSVVPIFREQIAAGGPVMVTHPDITRYFMTIPEAAQLVLQAGCMGRGGEIFVLDMGESVRIVDLAERMIKLSGLRPGVDIAITFSGLRPGEKLFEELLIAGEGIADTPHQKIHVAQSVDIDWQLINEKLDMLLNAAEHSSKQEIISCLKSVVPEYTGPENVTA